MKARKSKRTKKSKASAQPVPPVLPIPANDERSVLTLIKEIQAGTLSPENLTVRDRRLCVEHLSSEGYSVAEIAQVLKSTDRTISRDRAAIREANAVEASPEFTGEMVGTLVKEAENTISRIRRAERMGDATPADMINGEKICWEIRCDLIQTLQRLGILYTAPHVIQGQLAHHIEDLQSVGFEQMELEIDRLDVALKQTGSMTRSSPLFGEIERARKNVKQLALQEQVQDLARTVESACNSSSEDSGGDVGVLTAGPGGGGGGGS